MFNLFKFKEYTFLKGEIQGLVNPTFVATFLHSSAHENCELTLRI